MKRQIASVPSVAETLSRRHGFMVAPLWTVFISFASVASAQPNPKSDLEALRPGAGLEVQLFAADPAIAKPIQMNFDARGRLWIVTSESYPQLKPGEPPHDKIYVLEDTNGDGRADTSTLFADGLLIPTGIEIGDGGVYVGQSTELLHLKDTDGDGKADTRTVVLTGFGTEDTHHLIHTFRWGPDGWLHLAQSIYIHSHVETPWGVKRLNGGGFWRYRTDSQRLDVFVHGMVNSWGIAFDDYGQAFGVDNDDRREGSSLKYFLPGARFEFTPGEPHVLGGINRNKPKYCGAEILTGSHFPPEWIGDFVTCDFRAHRVVRYKLRDDGAGFASEEVEPILASANLNFRPIDVKVGPDGALYICDWYNPIINHGEVDFRDPRRDRIHGRVWRVTAKGRPLAPKPKLVDASIETLVALQGSPDGWQRHFARRVLAERPRGEVLEALRAWTAQQSDERFLLHALWTYETLHETPRELLVTLLNAKDARVRAAAVRQLGVRHSQFEDALALLMPKVRDPHPRVRMEAVRALASLGTYDAISAALAALDQPTDRFLTYAIELTARETVAQWLPILQRRLLQGKVTPTEGRRWTEALLAVDTEATGGPLLALWTTRAIDPKREAAILAAIGKHGGPDQLSVVLREAVQAGVRPERRERLLGALAEAHRLRRVVPSGDLAAALTPLFKAQESTPAIDVLVIRLAAAWKLAALETVIRELAENVGTPEAQRKAALEALRVYATPASKRTLDALATRGTSPWRDRAIEELALLAPDRAAEIVRERLRRDPKPADAMPALAALLRSERGPAALAKGLAGVTLSADVAREAIRLANASGRVQPDLLAAFVKAGNLPPAAQELSPEQMAQLVRAVQSSGDAQRGEAIYRREVLNCVKCHSIAGQGGAVGPDLTTIGASAPVDYLLESLLYPDRKVKENYHSVVVATTSGEVFTGIPVRRTERELVLRNAEDKLISIAVQDIESSRTGGSIMPVGLTEQLSTAEIVDLVRYLSELGKPGRYGPKHERIVRRWELLGPFVPAEAKRVGDRVVASGLELDRQRDAWQASLTTNDGWVYLRELALKPELSTLYATCVLEVDKPGRVQFLLEPANAPRLALGGVVLRSERTLEREAVFTHELPVGKHRLIVEIDIPKAERFLKLRAFALDGQASFEFR